MSTGCIMQVVRAERKYVEKTYSFGIHLVQNFSADKVSDNYLR